ncbi:hypothetical protein V502_02956, partial [Pseudogymnoascus sp. VKM F-4520 (FW-2644)]
DDGDDGLYGNQTLMSVDEDNDEEEIFKEEDPLAAKNFIAKTESAGFDGPQALEMVHQLYTMDYSSRRGGSKAADVDNKYHPLFFLDYICIVRQPLRPMTQRNERFFNNVTVTFKDWQEPYTAKASCGVLERKVVHSDAPNHAASCGAAILATGAVEETGEIKPAQRAHAASCSGSGVVYQGRLPDRRTHGGESRALVDVE